MCVFSSNLPKTTHTCLSLPQSSQTQPKNTIHRKRIGLSAATGAPATLMAQHPWTGCAKTNPRHVHSLQIDPGAKRSSSSSTTTASQFTVSCSEELRAPRTDSWAWQKCEFLSLHLTLLYLLGASRAWLGVWRILYLGFSTPDWGWDLFTRMERVWSFIRFRFRVTKVWLAAQMQLSFTDGPFKSKVGTRFLSTLLLPHFTLEMLPRIKTYEDFHSV